MKRTSLAFVSIILLTLILAACGGGDDPTSEPVDTPTPVVVKETVVVEVTKEVPATVVVEKVVEKQVEVIKLPEVNPLEVTGDIISAGSSTVFPLAERLAERFVAEGYGGNVTIDSIGSGAGFERFCTAGESDISNASRAIKDSEVENCAAIGRTPIEFRVGTDALAVVVNPENTFLSEGLTLEELAKIFSSETSTWADVNPAWPAEEIKRFSPGTDSGTFDYFIEAVMDPTFGDAAEETMLSAKNLQLSEDDNVLVQGVAGDKNGIGYFGFAYFLENENVITDLPIEGVSPSEATVNAGEYPLARPLFMYSDASIMASKPQVAAFLNFMLSYVDEEVIDVGYFPASDEALNQAKQNWLNAMLAEASSSSSEEAAMGAMLPEVNPLEVTGDIISAGSSTVFPLAERLAERFVGEGYAGNVTIDSIGSGAGFERFCTAGESDISNASRAIKDSEVENCAAIGRTPIEFRVGTDALAVVVNPENTFLSDGLTLEELAKIFSSETSTWADVNPAWPAEEIKRFSPGTDSGTFDYFIEAVMDPAFGDAAEETMLSAKNLQLSEDDNVLVQGVAGDKNGIGYFGFAYFLENENVITDLPIEGVSPSEATVNAGEYPLARPLFMYSDASIMASKPQVAAFLNFMLTYVNEEVIDVGYFPASDEALNQAKQNWLNAMGQ